MSAEGLQSPFQQLWFWERRGKEEKKYTTYHSVSVFGHKLQSGARGQFTNRTIHVFIHSFSFLRKSKTTYKSKNSQ